MPVISATWEVEMGEVGSRPAWGWKKVGKTLSQKTSQTPVIPATQEVEVGQSWSEVNPGQKHETLSEK
jgi:hypothetical protein